MPRVNNRRSGYVFSGIRSAMFGMWQHREMRSHFIIACVHKATVSCLAVIVSVVVSKNGEYS